MYRVFYKSIIKYPYSVRKRDIYVYIYVDITYGNYSFEVEDNVQVMEDASNKEMSVIGQFTVTYHTECIWSSI